MYFNILRSKENYVSRCDELIPEYNLCDRNECISVKCIEQSSSFHYIDQLKKGKCELGENISTPNPKIEP